MAKKEENISILRLILLCVHFHILSPSEAEHCLLTGELPSSIMVRLDRLKIADLKNKN